MKIDIWGTVAGTSPLHARRKWEPQVFAWVKAALPNRDETDILSVVEEVYAALSKIELRGDRGDASAAALVRKVARRSAWKALDRWQAAGYQAPLQALIEDAWGDAGAGDPARLYEQAQDPAPLTPAEVAEKYGLTLEEVDLLLSPGGRSGKDRVRICRLRKRLRENISKINGLDCNKTPQKRHRGVKARKNVKEITKDGRTWIEIAPGTFAPKADGPGKNVLELAPGVFVEKAFWGSPVAAEPTPQEKAEAEFFDRMTAALDALKKAALNDRDLADDLNAIEALNRANPSAWYCFEEIYRLVVKLGIKV